MSKVKEEAKQLVLELFGPINAEKVEKMDDSNSLVFLNRVKDLIAATLGSKVAEQEIAKLYTRYK